MSLGGQREGEGGRREGGGGERGREEEEGGGGEKEGGMEGGEKQSAAMQPLPHVHCNPELIIQTLNIGGDKKKSVKNKPGKKATKTSK